MRDALKANSELSALFDIGDDLADITFTAKTAGEGGVKVTSMTTTDTKTTIDKLAFKDGTDAYEKVTLVHSRIWLQATRLP